MNDHRSILSEEIQPEHGVVTLYGFNSSATVDRGHLVLTDRVGTNRRQGRFPRIRHGLERLIVIGSTGLVTFEALRWLADQRASFLLLDRSGSILFVSGPTGPSDARLRRAQSLSHHSGIAVQIARELIHQKLVGQENLVRDVLMNQAVSQNIASFRASLASAKSIQEIRLIESQSARIYWSTWYSLPINFPTSDLNRVPEHWRTFGTRKSPITGSPRLAVNPANAMLNYMYALLEAEARLAAVALGLDAGIGFIHADTDSRDSLRLDLMEVARPHVDRFLLEWLMSQPLRRDWFFEQRDGSCRLMAPFAVRLSQSSPAWRQILARIAEWVSRVLWTTFKHSRKWMSAPTHLTQSKRRDAKGKPHLHVSAPPRPPHLCRTCGKPVTRGYDRCGSCKVEVCTKELIKAARKGKVAAHTFEAEAKRGQSRRRHAAAIRAWKPSDMPGWLNEEAYRRHIQPKLASVKLPVLMAALGISKPYATNIRAGKRLPHPRHWQRLAQLAGGIQPIVD